MNQQAFDRAQSRYDAMEDPNYSGIDEDIQDDEFEDYDHEND